MQSAAANRLSYEYECTADDFSAARIPIRTVRISCEANRSFAFPAEATLEPYYALRGLIGAAITTRSRELERCLFKLQPLRDLGSSECSESPGTPWRLRLSHLYAREIPRRFDLVIDLFGEEPCDLAPELIDAVRLAGSGRLYRDWKTGRQRRWGLNVGDRGRDGNRKGLLTFDVLAANASNSRCIGDHLAAVAEAWRGARAATLVFRTLTILTSRIEGVRKGVPLAMTGDIDAVALIDNTLRRLALIDIATRRDPAERRRTHLRAVIAEKDRTLLAAAAEFPLRCVDAITIPVECPIAGGRRLRGLMGSATFDTDGALPWLPGFAACEMLGIGESAAYGAGQVSWLPIN